MYHTEDPSVKLARSRNRQKMPLKAKLYLKYFAFYQLPEMPHNIQYFTVF